MKILLISADYPPEECGGGGYVAKELVDQFIKKGNSVTVISSYIGNEEKIKEYRQSNLQVFWLPLKMKFLLKYIPNFKYSLPPSNKSKIFLKKFKYKDYEVIHYFSYPAHLLIDYSSKYNKEKNIITTIHAYPNYFENKNYFMRLFFKIYLKTIASNLKNKTRYFTTISESVKEDIHLKQNVNKDLLKVINNGINLKQYKFLKDKSINNRKIIKFLSIARITPHKSFETAVLALRKLPKDINYRYTIIGRVEDNEYFDNLKKLISESSLDNKIEFKGFISEKDKIKYLQESDIYIATSTAEGFGLTLLEAMACKCIVLATNIKGHKDVIKDKINGYLYKPKSSEELNILILKTISMKRKEYNLYLKNLNLFLKDFDWSIISDKYLEIYNQVKNEHSK